MKSAALALLAFALATNPASAEVRQMAADHFQLAFQGTITSPPAKVYASIIHVAGWWNSEHTWSGKAENLSLEATAGGCFCERWAHGSVEHGRVIMALKNQTLRLHSALGPLQEYALAGVLNFHLNELEDATTELLVDYRVNGSSASGLDQLAAPVDQVLGMQLERLLRYIDTGDPEAPVVESPEADPTRNEARVELIEEWAEEVARDIEPPSKKD
ncbi:hypothetical protein [Dokdonella sp.]|uniref:hypothetical protein n=1 Tax=Dokdonella sp. TaxID=2291710 RepID=UPI003C53FBA6